MSFKGLKQLSTIREICSHFETEALSLADPSDGEGGLGRRVAKDARPPPTDPISVIFM